MLSKLTFLSLLFLASCGSDAPELAWDSGTNSFLYDSKEGKIAVTFGKSSTGSTGSTFGLVSGNPKSQRDGINQLKIVVSKTLGTSAPTVVVKGLSCCSGKKQKTLMLTKDSKQPNPKVTAYTSQKFAALDATKPPYHFVVSTDKVKDLLLEL